MAKVTIGIPFYNAERYLADAIRSVINQSYSDWFLIVLNDGSTDNSLTIAKSFECNRIRVVSDGVNRGLVFRLNQLSQLSTSPYYARMDADDVMHRDRLSIQLSYLEVHPEVDVVGTGVYYINDINQIYGKGYAVSAAQTKKDALYGKNFYHPTIMGKADWFRQNPYDEKAIRMEDYELWVRTVEKSKFASIDKPLYFYREAGLPYLDKYLLSQKGIRNIMRKELDGFEKHWMLLRNYTKCIAFFLMTTLRLQDFYFRHKHVELTSEEKDTANLSYIESTRYGGGKKNDTIPKIIHYCWFGRAPLPALAIKCINSWKKFYPDYEIKEWNEDNYDVNLIPYTAEAYKAKKYAFVSDFARFWILYYYGGLYFDIDVEIIRPMDDIIERGSFMGFENFWEKTSGVNPGLGMGACPGLGFFKEVLDHYENEHFHSSDGISNLTTVVMRTTELLKQHGLNINNEFQTVVGINVYPFDYFCPVRITDGKLCLTNRTVSIHYFAASWTTPTHRFFRKIVLALGGYRLKLFLSRLFNYDD